MPRLDPGVPALDLAHMQGHDPALDIFLIANSKIFICENSGPMHIRSSFGKGSVYANTTQPGLISSYFHYGSINLPKIWYCKKTDSPIQLNKLLQHNFSWSELAVSECKNYKLKMVDAEVVSKAALQQVKTPGSIPKKHSNYSKVLELNNKFSVMPKVWAAPTKDYCIKYY